MNAENVYNSEEEVYNYNSLDAAKIYVGTEVTKSFSIFPAYQTSCEISFHDNKNNKNFRFTPKEDITAFELAVIFKMYVHAGSGFVDVSTYVKENGIERHFTEQ